MIMIKNKKNFFWVLFFISFTPFLFAYNYKFDLEDYLKQYDGKTAVEITSGELNCNRSSCVLDDFDGKIYDYVKIEKQEFGYKIAPVNTKVENGLIFYPGANVSCEAYLPILTKCAEYGIECFLVRMPLKLAMFNANAADKIINKPENSNIKNWYISGHSFGGAIAAIYTSKNINKLKGLIFLAAYSTKDVSGCDLKVLSIYGSEDGVLNFKNYEDCKKNLPVDFVEVEIAGGNHAGFGVYGNQKKDKTALISQENQQLQTVHSLVSFINSEE